jgi:2-amino-4-hydroxy-6-hydroxymethyldihydropteridine diphosphokinase
MTSNIPGNNPGRNPAALTAPALISLGANIRSPAGTPAQTLRAALGALAQRVEITAISPFYEYEAWPEAGDPAFINAAAALRTNLQPFALMALLHEIETHFGRTRSRPNAPRALDLDLLDYDGQVLAGPLILPHPRIGERRFVLEPLRDIAPHWRHPVSGKEINDLWTDLAAAIP